MSSDPVKTFIFLTKLTDAGASSVQDTIGRMATAALDWAALGGQDFVYYTTTGEYDHVMIGSAPTEEAAAAFALLLSQMGAMRTTTLRAYTESELQPLLAVAHSHV